MSEMEKARYLKEDWKDLLEIRAQILSAVFNKIALARMEQFRWRLAEDVYCSIGFTGRVYWYPSDEFMPLQRLSLEEALERLQPEQQEELLFHLNILTSSIKSDVDGVEVHPVGSPPFRR
jgi:hypothetical protein